MASAGWYGDPTREGRLRYWDGGSWTEHVSEGGGTAVEPITGIPPAPPAAAGTAAAGTAATGNAGATQVTGRTDEPASEAVPPPEWQTAGSAPALAGGDMPYAPTTIGRAGFVIAAIGGVLVAVTAGSTAVDQGVVTISVAGGSWIGVVAAVLCVAAAAVPFVWARIAGVTVSGLFALLVSFALIGFRTSDDLIEGIDVSLGAAGWMMLIGAILLFAGTAVALYGFRVPAREPDPSRDPSSGKALISLILGIVGVLIPVASAPAVGVGLLALDDDRVTDGRLGGRGQAKAGIILGIASLCVWGVGLLLGMLLAQP